MPSNVLPFYASSKLSRPLFEFFLKVKVMGLNPGYLLKSFLLYPKYEYMALYFLISFEHREGFLLV
jgi:hypothetical protein